MSEQLNISITGTFNDQLTSATNKAKTSLESLKKATEDLEKETKNITTTGAKVPGY